RVEYSFPFSITPTTSSKRKLSHIGPAPQFRSKQSPLYSSYRGESSKTLVRPAMKLYSTAYRNQQLHEWKNGFDLLCWISSPHRFAALIAAKMLNLPRHTTPRCHKPLSFRHAQIVSAVFADCQSNPTSE